MEENRLKPMVEDYDPIKFERLYKKTEALRRKLAANIDHRRFGVDNDEILSWFSVKFIYAYNKYCKKYNEDVLLGHMIKAMQFMKCRILKGAYTIKYSQSIVEYTGSDHNNLFKDDPREDQDYYIDRVTQFMKDNLSDNAYMLLQLKLNPPPYILRRLGEKSITNLHKIPDDLIAEYFDLGFSDKTYRYIDNLKKEIQCAVVVAKNHFRVSQQ